MARRISRMAPAIALAALLLGGSAGCEQQESREAMIARRVMNITTTTRSPFCPGKSLQSCPSHKAGEWRADIRTWVGQGLSDQQIYERLQARVPNFPIRPDQPTLGSWWLGVAVIALALLGVIAWWFRPRRAGPAEGESGDKPGGSSGKASEQWEGRLEDELSRMED